jgi:hypothetical protein
MNANEILVKVDGCVSDIASPLTPQLCQPIKNLQNPRRLCRWK